MTLRSRIKQTLSYSAFFDYPLTLNELHFWLITDQSISLTTLKKHLRRRDLKPNPKLRDSRRELTLQKIKANQPAINFLKSVPTINLIALTGSLAMANAKGSDDIDLMLITKKNTLWLTRLFVIPIFRLFFKARTPLHLHFPNSVCLNLWLDESSLLVPPKKHNLYIAHEVLQVKPLFNRHQTYEKFVLANSWTSKYLANSYKIISSKFSPLVPISLPLTSYLLSVPNFLAFKLQHLYMKSKITREHITLHSAYFHPRDLSAKIIKTVGNS